MPPPVTIALNTTPLKLFKRQVNFNEEDDNGKELSEGVKTAIGVMLAIFLLTVIGFTLVAMKKQRREQLMMKLKRRTSSYTSDSPVIASVPPAMPRSSLFSRPTWPRPDPQAAAPEETMMRSVETLPRYTSPPAYSGPHKRPGS
ncbi:hypothetical protein VNI00_003508 [Paramarasmius palmivorus]|uniref:Uncharacterized protein n=1 Tax=Paramarasmius palmivorus TaxID=297713 RepID=A0AAW0DTI6_9AGAR